MDVKFVQAVQQPNSKFRVKEFSFVMPENADLQAVETMPVAKIVRPSTKRVQDSIKSQKLQLLSDDYEETATVKVESIGMSSVDQPLPDYSPYFPHSVFPLQGNRDEATLILEPNSKAISGNDGTSISTPLSRALLRRGSAVKLLFRPQSVAISGAGGTSHAQADLIVDFIDEFEEVDDSVRLPYIGGAKGQVLEIRQRPDGTIFSRILMDEPKKDESITDVETIKKEEENSFENNLLSIQQAAAELVAIQEAYKQSGQITNEQRRKYSQSLEKLGISAQRIANSQTDEDSLRLLLDDDKKKEKKDKDTRQKPQALFPPFNNNNKDKEKEKEENCEEGVVGEEGADTTTKSPSGGTYTKSTTTTTVKPITTSKKPPVIVSNSQSATATDGTQSDEEESSVAEAKPVGLAIAGVGGVASSKPIGTAVVGPGGLAVARPSATAIAGLKPSEISSLGLSLPSKLKNLSARGNAVALPSRGKYGLVQLGQDDDDTEILVGPDFLAEARLSDKGIDSSGSGDIDDDFDNDDKVESDESINAQESDSSKRPNAAATSEKDKDEINELDNKQVEPLASYQFPYNIDFNKLPYFPPTFENALGYQLPSPIFLPPNSYAPIPIAANQYLQRRATLRYPPFLYPSLYGQNNNAAANYAQIPYAPFRLFYAPQ